MLLWGSKNLSCVLLPVFLQHLGAFGPLKLKETNALEKLHKQAVIIEQLITLCITKMEITSPDESKLPCICFHLCVWIQENIENDCDNLRTLVIIKYGQEIKFKGALDKYYSTSVFAFNLTENYKINQYQTFQLILLMLFHFMRSFVNSIIPRVFHRSVYCVFIEVDFEK